MAWLEVTAQIPEAEADPCQATLEDLGAVAVTLLDASETPLLEPDPGATPLWDLLKITGLFDENTDKTRLKSKLRSTYPETDFSLTSLPEQDWTRAWLAHFHPQKFGKHLWIIPTDYPELPELGPEPVILTLDPGLAFGTGTHPTTALCLSWLANGEIKNKKVIDFGCGSGILGIAACLLGAAQVWALDHDPQAITATQQNALQNKIPSDNLKAHLSEDKAVLPEVDIVLANILAQPLIDLAPILQSHCRVNGHLVLSGILENQAKAVQAAYEVWFDFEPVAAEDGWVRLVGIKKRP